MGQFKKLFRAICLLSLVLTGCNIFVDDQRYLPDSLFEIANPIPLDRNFVVNNHNHKVLVAVIDSGVDYNHRDLVSAMHFDLSSDGYPTGLGWDYLGEDAWPAPYLVRTTTNQQLNNVSSRLSNQNKIKILEAIKAQPSLANKIHEDRSLEDEIRSGSSHGTHVAGILADMEESSIGIIPYRVLPLPQLIPMNERALNSEKLIERYMELVFSIIMDAHHRAYDKGARIFNLSMVHRHGIEFGRNSKMFQLLHEQIDEYKRFLDERPDLLIVAAAGNDYGLDLADKNKILQLPCGIDHPQILCVGSVDEIGNRSVFSNIFSNNPRFISEHGENIYSAYPTNYCDVGLVGLEQLDWLMLFGSSILKSSTPKVDANSVIKNCNRNKSLHMLSGTSMATPKVAKKAALLKKANPNMNVQQIIQALIR